MLRVKARAHSSLGTHCIVSTLYQQSAKVRHSQQHFAKLEKAHQAQAAYIQKLQSENQKIEGYKATIRTQERVVAKLEELIETKLRDRKDGGTTTTFRLKQEITRLQRRNQELEKKVFAGGMLYESPGRELG